MLTITKVHSASNARSYYTADTPGGQQAASEWQGGLTLDWDLSGAVVGAVELERALNGWTPDSQDPLLSHRMPNRISAIDCTFKAPKSISIEAIANGDQELLVAHREAVSVACGSIERDSQTKVKRQQRSFWQDTGVLAIAKFEHTLSRLNDPHLHTHCIVINATKHQGRYMGWASRKLFKNIKHYGAIYRDALMEKVQALGHRLRKAAKNWELASVPDAIIKRFSKRQAQIDEHAGHAATMRDREIASVITRPRKQEKNLDDLRRGWELEKFSVLQNEIAQTLSKDSGSVRN